MYFDLYLFVISLKDSTTFDVFESDVEIKFLLAFNPCATSNSNALSPCPPLANLLANLSVK